MSHKDEYGEELKKLGLSTKDDLRNLLKPLILDAVKFEPIEAKQALKDSQLISHFGGLPYFEKGESWPKVKDGWQKDMPLYFIFQIINDGNMNLPGHIRILQFFITYPETPFETDDGGWLVKTYESISPEKLGVVEGPKSKYNPNYCEIKFSNTKSLPAWDGLDEYSPEAEKLALVLDEEEGDNFEEAVTGLIGDHDIYSAIGGYPHWIQSDETPTNSKDKKLPLLFQLDSESNAGLSWGSMGVLYIFYDPKNERAL